MRHMLCRYTAVIVLLFGVLLTGSADASATVPFPKDWKRWKLVKSIAIPSAETKLPKELSPLFRETIRTYNWVNFGKAVDLDIYVNPTVYSAYAAGGPYPDGVTSVGVFRGVNVVFVTAHKNGQALFATYDEKGRDISRNHSSFSPKVCSKCHYHYDECKNRYGVCSQPAAR